MARSSILVCALVAAAAAGASCVDATGHHDLTKDDIKSSKQTLKQQNKVAKHALKDYKHEQKDKYNAGTITKDEMKSNENEAKEYYHVAKNNYKHGLKSWSKHVGEDVYSSPFTVGKDQLKAGWRAAHKGERKLGYHAPIPKLNPWYR